LFRHPGGDYKIALGSPIDFWFSNQKTDQRQSEIAGGNGFAAPLL
jgi:hypothetical protein